MQVKGTLGDRAGLAPLKHALHAYALRHRVIASNLANSEVEGYKPRRVVFEDIARKALGAVSGVAGYVTDPKHIPVGNGPESPITPRVETEPPPPGEDGGVDVEGEMVSLVENQLSYRLAVRLLDMKYNTLHKAIRGSSR
jgi:flagellar basal-body rod protein FlgB